MHRSFIWYDLVYVQPNDINHILHLKMIYEIYFDISFGKVANREYI